MIRLWCVLALLAMLVFANDTQQALKLLFKRDVASVSMRLDTDVRTNGEEWIYYHLTGGMRTNINKHLSVTFAYREVRRLSQSIWKIEKRPYIQLTQRIKTGLGTLSFRNRVEYRIRDVSTFRNRFRVMLKGEQWGLRPFISNEFFYDVNNNEYHKNWFSVGSQFGTWGWATPSVYYKNVGDHDNGAWESTHSIVVKLVI